MESQLAASLIDAGITGVFLLYLMATTREQSRRLDAYVDRLLKTLETIEEEREKGFDKIRDRYDEVIAKYDGERDTLLRDISAKLDEGLKEMQNERLARIAKSRGK
jgi:hypothetical protein|tara:strand:+ start:2058 stop:2375 length:318 start_codon:yes stop_codon:yes gene_type:complete